MRAAKKLNLSKETLRKLTSLEPRFIHGGLQSGDLCPQQSVQACPVTTLGRGCTISVSAAVTGATYTCNCPTIACPGTGDCMDMTN